MLRSVPAPRPRDDPRSPQQVAVTPTYTTGATHDIDNSAARFGSAHDGHPRPCHMPIYHHNRHNHRIHHRLAGTRPARPVGPQTISLCRPLLGLLLDVLDCAGFIDRRNTLAEPPVERDIACRAPCSAIDHRHRQRRVRIHQQPHHGLPRRVDHPLWPSTATHPLPRPAAAVVGLTVVGLTGFEPATT